MNNTFNLARFAKLLKKHLTEHGRGYALISLVLCGIMFVFYGFLISKSLNSSFKGSGIQEFVFAPCLFLSCVAFTTSFYSFFLHPAKGIQWLQLPASQTEKFILAFIVTQVLFIITFLGCFYLNDWIFTSVYNRFHVIPDYAKPDSFYRYHANLFDLTSNDVKNILLTYFLLAPLAHFSCLLFKKNVFVKTALIVLTVMFAYMLGNFYMLKMLIPVEDGMPRGVFFNIGYRIEHKGNSPLFVELPPIWQNVLSWLLPTLFISGLWLAGFFKLKEKQV